MYDVPHHPEGDDNDGGDFQKAEKALATVEAEDATIEQNGADLGAGQSGNRE